MHAATIVDEIRDLEPTGDGWARYEPTGRACVVCPCGLNTGFVDATEAMTAFMNHSGGTPERRTQPVQVQLVPGEFEKELLRLLRKLPRSK